MSEKPFTLHSSLNFYIFQAITSYPHHNAILLRPLSGSGLNMSLFLR